VHRWSLALLTGCGRLGFESVEAVVDSSASDASDASDESDAMIDGPTGGQMTFTFGEAPVTMFKSVTRDTYISNEAGESLFNYGADDEVRIELDAGERGLVAFDVSVIPQGANIVGASLAITVTQIPPVPLPINLHNVNEQWDEGTAAGASGVANFLFRTGGLPWLTSGAGPGLSSAGAAFGSFTPVLGPQTIAIPPPAVESWVATPLNNAGFIMISTSDESTRFTTSEGTPAANRPVLTVTFTP